MLTDRQFVAGAGEERIQLDCSLEGGCCRPKLADSGQEYSEPILRVRIVGLLRCLGTVSVYRGLDEAGAVVQVQGRVA